MLLLDEPLASVDETLKQRVFDYLDGVLQEWQIPTLYVTHDAEEVKRLAQRVVMLNQGQISSVGTTEQLFGGG